MHAAKFCHHHNMMAKRAHNLGLSRVMMAKIMGFAISRGRVEDIFCTASREDESLEHRERTCPSDYARRKTSKTTNDRPPLRNANNNNNNTNLSVYIYSTVVLIDQQNIYNEQRLPTRH